MNIYYWEDENPTLQTPTPKNVQLGIPFRHYDAVISFADDFISSMHNRIPFVTFC